MKLIYKFILGLLIGVLVGGSFLVYATYALVKSSLVQSIETEQQQLARQTMEKVDRVLYERYLDIQSMAGDETITTFLSTPGASGSSSLSKRVGELRSLSGPWDDIHLIGIDGVIRYSADPQRIGTQVVNEVGHTAAFTVALSGSVYYSDVVPKEGTKNTPTMHFAVPVRSILDPEKPIIGVIVADLSWSRVSEVLNTIHGPIVDIYNHQGLEIANNDDPEAILVVNNREHSNVKNVLAGKESSELTTSVDSTIETLSSAVTEKGFLSYEGNKWVLLIEQPSSVAFAPAVAAALKVAALIISVTVLSGSTVIFLFIQFLKPINDLTAVAIQISQGDLNRRAKVTSRDEIGRLAMAFDYMADTLQDLNGKLEQKVQEKTAELLDANAQDEAILSSIGEGMVAVNTENEILKVNKSLIAILGLQDQDVVGKKVFDAYIYYGIDGNVILPENRSGSIVLRTGKQAEGTYEIRPGGVKKVIHITSSPVVKAGQIIGAVSIFHDVTKEREIDRMKTEFISLASHQLRTPLSAIKWFTEMLLAGDAGKLETEQNDFVKNISASTERMIQLVNSLLNISRIESGRIIVDPKPTDLKELVKEIVNDLKGKLEEKKQNLVISVHEDLPLVNIDPKLIGQVYLNLLTNAIKYTPADGDITVFISRKGEEIISQVSDNGYGIPRAQQSRLFQRFFRADNVRKIETEGTGLGLYLVKAIVESSQGKIWFESHTKDEVDVPKEKHGTTFWFSLPVSGTPAKVGEVALDV
ncbi:MAG: ATP-binding protein [Candidatus Woesebacteria bacterium]